MNLSSQFKSRFELSQLIDRSIFFLCGLYIIGICRCRLLYFLPNQSPSFESIMQAMAPDMTLLGLFLALSFLFKYKRHWAPLYSLFVGILVVNILFQINMHIPLTLNTLPALLNLFNFRAEFDAKSNFAPFMISVVLFLSFLAMAALIFAFKEKLRRPFPIFTAALFLFFTITTIKQLPSPPSYAENMFTQLWQPATIRMPDAPMPETHLAPTLKNKKNLMVIYIHQLEPEILNNQNLFIKIMPNLFSFTQQMKTYKNNYSFSSDLSKNLYALVCGQYPSPLQVNELRFAPTRDCNSWIRQLRDQKVDTHFLLSGDKRYNNLGKFLKRQGFSNIHDRKSLTKNADFHFNRIAIDDFSLVDWMDQNLQNKKDQPFLALFLHLGLVPPRLNPHKDFKLFNNPIYDAHYYQDYLIGQYWKKIKAKGLHKNTVVVITGDNRKTSPTHSIADTVENLKTPLFIFDPELKKLSPMNRPTSVAYLGQSLLKWSGMAAKINARYTLESPLPSFIAHPDQDRVSVISEENRFFTFNRLSGEAYLNGKVMELTECKSDCQQAMEALGKFLNISTQNFPEFWR